MLLNTRITLALLSGLILFFSSCQTTEEVIDPPAHRELSYSFFVAGHTYGAPGSNNIGMHPPFQTKFNLITDETKMEFGVLTGDIVVTGTTQNWDQIDSVLLELDMPVHFAVGNHDMTDRPLYESRYGQTYSSFKFNSDLFIILDPNIDGWNISGDQLTFLQNQVSTSNLQGINNIFVFFHQVLWWESNNIYHSVPFNSLQGRASSINFWTEVEPLFNGLSQPVNFFAGDVGAFPSIGAFMYHKYDNISLISSGMGGGTADNFIIVDIYSDGSYEYRLIAINGNNVGALGKLEDYTL